MRQLLCVEDNEDNLYMLQLRFDMPYEVLSARDGVAGIVMAISKRPDLILMDLNLPLLDGWEATRRLRADPATRDILTPEEARRMIAGAGHRGRQSTRAPTRDCPQLDRIVQGPLRNFTRPQPPASTAKREPEATTATNRV